MVMNTTPVLSERDNSKIKIDKFEVRDDETNGHNYEYGDGDNDDDDHVEAGGVQARRRQAGREGARRENHTEAFQFGQQLFKIISMIIQVINDGCDVIC